MEDDKRSGKPLTTRTEEMIEKGLRLIQCDRRMTIVEMEQEVGISLGSVHAILTKNSKMRRSVRSFYSLNEYYNNNV